MRDGARVLLLGCGAQGRAALHDLVTGDDTTHVVVAEASPEAAAFAARHPASRVTVHRTDAGDSAAIGALMRGVDVVIEALPGPFALPMGRLAVEQGVSLVSSMYYRDPQERDPARVAAAERAVGELGAAAAARGLTLLTEFGLDPGLDLVMAVRALAELDAVEEFHAYGAGLPAPDAADNALHYKFSWSPIGVMRSYNRPARVIRGGRAVEIPPAEIFEPRHVHTLDVPAMGGVLECYANGDAVHYAELFGLQGCVREMARYTGRWPGHCAFWNVMVKCGFLDPAPMALPGGAHAAPQEFVAALLASQPRFRYADHEADLAFVRVDVRGVRRGKRTRVVYDVVDRRDFATGLTAMQRTVGFTLAAGARLILAGSLPARGLLTPLDVPYDLVFPALERRGIRVTRQESAWA
ncbi:MAG: saccharopine dehydrogenase NADP-binding domain-containing protein [Gemmatimonadota bacterium]|nr:saccharopine dehydrogenase NADP-binding domain-containing protein [Gemmatimonadota bacterium]